jgi:hypothetical protein
MGKVMLVILGMVVCAGIIRVCWEALVQMSKCCTCRHLDESEWRECGQCKQFDRWKPKTK